MTEYDNIHVQDIMDNTTYFGNGYEYMFRFAISYCDAALANEMAAYRASNGYTAADYLEAKRRVLAMLKIFENGNKEESS